MEQNPIQNNLGEQGQKQKILSQEELKNLSSFEQEEMIKKSELFAGTFDKFEQNYEFNYELGKGGYGGVYKGYDKRRKCNVAIKIMPLKKSQFQENVIPIFHELQVVQNLFVPGEDTTQPLYVMKCMEYYYKKEKNLGQKDTFELFFIYPLAMHDLYEQIKINRKHQFNLSEDQVIIFLFQILMGLKQMKQVHGIRHRDLKPQNILLFDQFTYLLADFTTCKINEIKGEESIIMKKDKNQIERNEEVPITWQYTSPEVKIWRRQKKNLSEFKLSAEKNDIFGLAVTALCLLNFDTEAEKISDLNGGEELIKKLLLKIKNLDLRFLIGKMAEWNFETRFTIDQSLDQYYQKFDEFEKERYDNQIRRIFRIVKEISPSSQEQKNKLKKQICDMIDQYEFQFIPNFYYSSASLQLQKLNTNLKIQNQFQDLQLKIKNLSEYKIIEIESLSKAVQDIQFSNSKKFFGCCSFGELQIYDSVQKNCVQKLKLNYQSYIYKLRYSEDDQFIFCVGYNGYAGILQKQQDQKYKVIQELKLKEVGHNGGLEINSQNKYGFYFGGDDRVLYHYEQDIDSQWKLKQKVLTDHSHNIFCLQLSPDKSKISSGSADGSIIVFNSQNLQQIIKLDFFEQSICDIKIMNDNNTLIACSRDGSIKLINIQKNQIEQNLTQHKSWVVNLFLDQKQQYMYSVSLDQLLIRWKNKQSGMWTADQEIDLGDQLFSLAVNQQNDEILIGFENSKLKFLK